MKRNLGSGQVLHRFTRFLLASASFVVLIVAPMAPQESTTGVSADGRVARYVLQPLSIGVVHNLETLSFRNLMSGDAAVLLVFFSSDAASLYSREDSSSLGPGNAALGASLAKPPELDALLNVTSLVPQAPAWEPLVYDPVFSRLVPFPDRRRSISPGTAHVAWLHDPSNSQSACCMNHAASIVW